MDLFCFIIVHWYVLIAQMSWGIVLLFRWHCYLPWPNEKNVRADAAQSIILSWVTPSSSHTALIFLRIVGVIGSLRPVFTCSTCTPRMTCCSLGIAAVWGSGKPWVIWPWRAPRYALIVACTWPRIGLCSGKFNELQKFRYRFSADL